MKKRTRTKPAQKGTTFKQACEFLNGWANDPGPTQEEYEEALKGTGLSRFKLIWRMRNITDYRNGQMGILIIKAKRGNAFKRTDGSFDTSHLPITTKRYLCAHGTQALLID
tara:strand:+ start:282 stop:614 length:333 start_codon:yes stop_codon:yes gene_type:complete